MYTFIYEGVTYNSKKELREATGLSGCKIRALVNNGKIKMITN